LRQNYISEILDGAGILADASTVLFEQNQVKRCHGGMLLQSSQNYQTTELLQQIENFAILTIEQGTVHQNTGFGVAI
jgi:hypothetical protein